MGSKWKMSVNCHTHQNKHLRSHDLDHQHSYGAAYGSERKSLELTFLGIHSAQEPPLREKSSSLRSMDMLQSTTASASTDVACVAAQRSAMHRIFVASLASGVDAITFVPHKPVYGRSSNADVECSDPRPLGCIPLPQRRQGYQVNATRDVSSRCSIESQTFQYERHWKCRGSGIDGHRTTSHSACLCSLWITPSQRVVYHLAPKTRKKRGKTCHKKPRECASLLQDTLLPQCVDRQINRSSPPANRDRSNETEWFLNVLISQLFGFVCCRSAALSRRQKSICVLL